MKKYSESKKKTPDAVVKEVSKKLQALEPGIIYEQYNFEKYSYDLKTGQGEFAKQKTIFAETMYYFWIKEVPCLNCNTKVPLFRGYMLAQKRDGKGYHVICPGCGNLFDVKDYRKDANCPECKREFNPDKDGNVDGKYYICTESECGQKSVIVEAIQRRGKPSERLYAVEYYCPSCNEKGYKQADEFDQVLFEKARDEYKKVEPEWLGKYIPNTSIPKGQEAYPRLIENHGYKYWKDMFNERQLLSLGNLLKAILELNVDENVRELLLITFSDTLNYQNMLCEYNRKYTKLRELFSSHAFHPVINPVENSIWGTKFGYNTFKVGISKLSKGKSYNLLPFEKLVENGKTLEKQSKIKIQGKICDLFNSKGNIQISCGDSSYLSIPDISIDAIITDPPYYGNVMYSELSEFYYSWLRLALKNKYEYFQSEHVPNTAEVIVNRVQEKEEKDFIEGLTAVFKEAGKKLKKDGIMTFTFHHQEEKAWGAVLQAVLNAGFISYQYILFDQKVARVCIL